MNPHIEQTLLLLWLYNMLLKLNVCVSLLDLVEVVKKRVCDMRWEVRDSTVEFLGHLAGVRVFLKSPEEVCDASEALLGGCCTTPLLREALQDTESYVRASAISGLAKTLAHSWQQGAALTQEEVGRNSFTFDSEKTVGTRLRGRTCCGLGLWSFFYQLCKILDDLTKAATRRGSHMKMLIECVGSTFRLSKYWN